MVTVCRSGLQTPGTNHGKEATHPSERPARMTVSLRGSVPPAGPIALDRSRLGSNLDDVAGVV